MTRTLNLAEVLRLHVSARHAGKSSTPSFPPRLRSAAAALELLLLLAGAAAPASAETTRLDTPVLAATVDDHVEGGCWPRVEGLCAGRVSTGGDGVGDEEAYAHHDLRHVGVATNLSLAKGAAGDGWPVEDAHVGADLADFFLPWPVFALADEALELVPWPDERYRAEVENEEKDGRDALAVYYYGPSTRVPTEWGQREAGMQFSREFGPSYDGLRLVSTPGPWISDREFNSLHLFCGTFVGTAYALAQDAHDLFEGRSCWQQANATAEAAKAHTPSIVAGVHTHQFDVATDPSCMEARACEPPGVAAPRMPRSAPAA